MREKGNWKVLDTKTIYKDRWMEVLQDKVIRPNGEPGHYGTVKLNDGVAFLPLDDEGNVHLCRQYRYAAEDEFIEVPAGFLDKGETPLDAAKRELKEELGITAADWTDLGITHLATGYITNSVPFFLARDLTFGKSDPDDSEEIKPLKIKMEEAVQMVMDGRITNIVTMTLILKANEFLRRK